jgi:hypothetical protein
LDSSGINGNKYGEDLRVVLLVIFDYLNFCSFDFGICQKIGVVVGGKVVESTVGKGVPLGRAGSQEY